MIQATVNFIVFLIVFLGHELWNYYRLKKNKSWFIATEVNGFKLFCLAMAASTYFLDLYLNAQSYFSYFVIFGLFFYLKREIASDYIRIGLGRYTYKTMTKVEISPDPKGKNLIVRFGDKHVEGVIRKGLDNGLEEAVKLANKKIKELNALK